MKKSVKIGLGICGSVVAITGAVAGTVIGLQNKNSSNSVIDSVVTNNSSKPAFSIQDIINANKQNANNANVQKPTIVDDSQKIATFDLQPNLDNGTSDSKTQSFTLTIQNLNESLGKIVFTDSEGKANNGTTLANITAETQVFVKAVDVKDGYTLYGLDVSCKGNESYTLETRKASEGVYTFTLPPLVVEGRPNPFYNGQTSIEVKATFAEAQINGWTYNFNIKSYMYQITDDNFVLDDSGNFAMKDVSATNIPVKYVLDLNGHDLGIKTFTIPKGCDLILVNTKEGTMPTVKNANANDGKVENKFGHIRLGGGLVQYNQTYKWGQFGEWGATWNEYVEISSFFQLGVNE